MENIFILIVLELLLSIFTIIMVEISYRIAMRDLGFKIKKNENIKTRFLNI